MSPYKHSGLYGYLTCMLLLCVLHFTSYYDWYILNHDTGLQSSSSIRVIAVWWLTGYQGCGYTGRMRIYTLPNRYKNKNKSRRISFKKFSFWQSRGLLLETKRHKNNISSLVHGLVAKCLPTFYHISRMGTEFLDLVSVPLLVQPSSKFMYLPAVYLTILSITHNYIASNGSVTNKQWIWKEVIASQFAVTAPNGLEVWGKPGHSQLR
jgi:hypothetical protein